MLYQFKTGRYFWLHKVTLWWGSVLTKEVLSTMFSREGYLRNTTASSPNALTVAAAASAWLRDA